jgi:hypothetical protein
METIDLGFKKFEITKQAFIVFIALVVSIFAQLIILIFFVEDTTVLEYVIFILYIVIAIPLIVYANNCFVSGKCVVLSWAFAVGYVALSVFNVFAMIGLVMIRSKKTNDSNKISLKKSSR